MGYRYESVLANIQEKVAERYGVAEARPSRHKVLYGEMGLDKSEWSRKLRGKTKFTFDEIAFLKKHFEAPPGWPYLSWSEAEATQRAFRLLERMAADHPPEDRADPAAAAPSGQPERRTGRGQK